MHADQAAAALESRRHWNVPDSEELKLKAAEALAVGPLGPELIVVCGGTATVKVAVAGVGSKLPAPSPLPFLDLTSKRCEPSARPV